MPEATPDPKPAPGAPLLPIEMSPEMLGAFKVVVDDQASRRNPADTTQPAAKPIGWMIAAGVSWGTLMVLLLFQPAIARMPEDRTFAAPPELRAASLRLGLWLARHRVDDFRRTTDRLPAYGGEAGLTDRTILFEAKGRDHYTLIARDSTIELRLTSEMSADSSLGASLTALVASRAYQQAGIPGRTAAR
jgi:hypothetical protein